MEGVVGIVGVEREEWLGGVVGVVEMVGGIEDGLEWGSGVGGKEWWVVEKIGGVIWVWVVVGKMFVWDMVVMGGVWRWLGRVMDGYGRSGGVKVEGM